MLYLSIILILKFKLYVNKLFVNLIARLIIIMTNIVICLRSIVFFVLLNASCSTERYNFGVSLKVVIIFKRCPLYRHSPRFNYSRKIRCARNMSALYARITFSSTAKCTPKFLSKFPLNVIEIAKGNIQTTFLGRFVFRLTSFHGNSRSSFPRDSHFRMSELLTTIFRCRAIFIRYVSVAGLLVCQPATV